MQRLAVLLAVLACIFAATLMQPSAEGVAVQAKRGSLAKVVQRGADTCAYARDNECDEPDIGTGACGAGTDYSDCRFLREGEKDACPLASNGSCDEVHFGSGACIQGADRSDCGAVARLRNRNDSCRTSFNGVCEEPGRGRGCAARTDRTDCSGRERPLSISDHFFGADDRVRVDARQPPWRFVGRFVNTAEESCTATLIAPDVIVTAAHCIHNEDGVSAEGRFRPAGGGGSARTTAYLVDRRFNYLTFLGGESLDGLDWALLRLDRRLGDALGFASVGDLIGKGEAPALRAELLQAGYGWDTGETLAGHLGCRVTQVLPLNTFAHACDTTRGDSGSGFFVRDGERHVLVGIDSNFRLNPEGPTLYIAVGAGAFRERIANFVAGHTGTPIRSTQR